MERAGQGESVAVEIHEAVDDDGVIQQRQVTPSSSVMHEDGVIQQRRVTPSSSMVREEEAENRDKGKAVYVKTEALDPNWVNSIKERRRVEPKILKASSGRSSCSIHRVPARFRERGDNLYIPQIISIGPFHYHKRREELEAMEEHKWRYLNDILTRNGDDCLEGILMSLKLMEERARQCYSEKIELESEPFVEMMVLDACFIIELFFRAMVLDEYKDDPILSQGWLRFTLRRDLGLFENQIPFFILQHIFNMMNFSGPSLANISVNFFGYNFCETNIQFQHLLHLLHNHTTLLPENDNQMNRPLEMIPCASELLESGIKFKKRDDFHSRLDIRFQKGVIEIPPLEIEYLTNPLFLNLLVFEQCYRHCDSRFTTYTIFMDLLINSAKDVRILSDSGIIENWLGCHEDVANLFNKMAVEATLYTDQFYLLNVMHDINQHYETAWHKWRALLMRNYFNSPWAIISVIAAVILLLLTFTQTFFSSFPSFAHG